MDHYPLREGQPRWGNEMAERQLDLALQVANAPAEFLRREPPPLPQIQVWRARDGYPTYQQRQIHIEDVIDVDRIFTDPRINWTGTPAGYSGTARPSLEQP